MYIPNTPKISVLMIPFQTLIPNGQEKLWLFLKTESRRWKGAAAFIVAFRDEQPAYESRYWAVVLTEMSSDRLPRVAQRGTAKYPVVQCVVVRCTRTGLGLYRFMVKHAQVVDQMPDSAEDTMAPDKVSPAIVFLCTDEAKDITGRQFGVRGNRCCLAASHRSDSLYSKHRRE